VIGVAATESFPVATTQAVQNADSGIFYHYVVVRQDVPLGVQLAQVTHAAGESSPGCTLPKNTHAVVLHATEEQLLALEIRLHAAGLDFSAIREPDAPFNGAITAIGLAPQPRTQALKRLMSGFKLAKE
jgi:hypothetical protein